MPCSRPRAGQRQCRCVSGRVPERAQTGRAVRVVLREFNPYAGPTGGVDKMPNGRHGSAHPLAASPVTSGLREDECTGPSPVCARGRYHTRPAARRGVAGHRQVTGRAAARPVEAVGARGHHGGQYTGAAGSPGHPDKVWVARRPSVPKGRLDNHRRAPRSCYTPALPLWRSRPSHARA